VPSGAEAGRGPVVQRVPGVAHHSARAVRVWERAIAWLPKRGGGVWARSARTNAAELSAWPRPGGAVEQQRPATESRRPQTVDAVRLPRGGPAGGWPVGAPGERQEPQGAKRASAPQRRRAWRGRARRSPGGQGGCRPARRLATSRCAATQRACWEAKPRGGHTVQRSWGGSAPPPGRWRRSWRLGARQPPGRALRDPTGAPAPQATVAGGADRMRTQGQPRSDLAPCRARGPGPPGLATLDPAPRAAGRRRVETTRAWVTQQGRETDGQGPARDRPPRVAWRGRQARGLPYLSSFVPCLVPHNGHESFSERL